MKNHANPNKSRAPAKRGKRHGVTLLSAVYLDAGLPLAFAVRSAIADCELFESGKAGGL